MSAEFLPIIPKIGDNGTGSALDSGVDKKCGGSRYFRACIFI